MSSIDLVAAEAIFSESADHTVGIEEEFGILDPVTLDLANEVIFKGIRVHGITGRRLFSTWYRLAGLFKAGLNIRPVITHTFPLKDFAKGFELIKSGQCGKVVLFP